MPKWRKVQGRPTGRALRYAVPRRIELGEDLMYLFGVWIGDGCVTHRAKSPTPIGIQVAFHEERANRLKHCAAVIERVFGVTPSISRSRGQQCRWLWASSMPLGEFFESYFGKGFSGKRIPAELMQAPLPLVRALLRGLFHADGCATNDVVFVQFSNRALAVQVHQLLMRLGYLFSIRGSAHVRPGQPAFRVIAPLTECPDLVRDFFGRDVPTRKVQRAYSKADGLFWVRVDGFEQTPYRGTVLDLEVEEDHSFITAGVVVSNCFVLPSPEDSRAGILDNLKLMIEIMARGGGVGVNLSSLRPRGSYIRTVNGTSSGPCAWAELYSVATGDVIQQGGTRRGALMLMLDDWHPDIEEFITVKTDLHRLLHANLSVCISDAFMAAVRDDADWPLTWQGEVKRVVKARALWDRICEAAWRSAEPGLVFIDRVNQENNLGYCETITCVNPCGEEPIGPWNVCNLGALNLAAFVLDGRVDSEGLAEHTRAVVRFLDDVIDATPYFLAENEAAQRAVRRIGLGTMGLADALLALGVRYGSDESLGLIEAIYRTIRDAAYDASADLAAEKGPFPQFDRDRYLDRPFTRRLPETVRTKIAAHGIRNGVLLCQAPTGTTSLLAGVSSGIEPVYDFRVIRRDRLGEHVIEHPAYRAWREAHPDAPLPDHFVTAGDLSPEEHVRVQAKIQEYTCAAVSKTTNAPKTHTVAEVRRLYQLAYELGCKGITYYRDGSRPAVLYHGDAEPGLTTDGLLARPRALRGTTYRTETPLGTAFVTVNAREDGDDAEPFEVFLNIGKAGSDIAALAEAIGRLCSLCLRLPGQLSSGARVAAIVGQLGGIGGERSLGFGPKRVRSLPDAVARVLAEAAGLTNGAARRTDSAALPDLCPSCGQATLVRREGCLSCSCGFSEC